jgi:hypothetical protein
VVFVGLGMLNTKNGAEASTIQFIANDELLDNRGKLEYYAFKFKRYFFAHG